MFTSAQRQILTHKPLITAQLTQSMNLLTLNAAELRQTVQRALADNPALELTKSPRCPACHCATLRPGLCPLCARHENASVIVFTAPSSQFSDTRRVRSGDPYAEPVEAESAETTSLAVYLLRQIAPELARADRPIAAHLLAGLDDDGLLHPTAPAEIAAYFHVALAQVEAVRRQIQQVQPVGCASLAAREALQTQLDSLEREIPAAARACLGQFELFSRQKFSELAALTGLTEDSLREAERFIAANLTPYPARAFWPGNPQPETGYRTPDVIIRPLDERPEAPLVVEIAQPFNGILRIKPQLRQQNNTQDSEPWRDALEQASLLVKALHQRASALEMMMTRIAALQREFILRGDAYLQPLTRAQLAEDLCLHESTISRAVASKTVQLPGGKIVQLARFFERNRNIRAALRRLVSAENRPLNDDELARCLQRMGFAVARRTVAKYRELEHIPPARQRLAQERAA